MGGGGRMFLDIMHYSEGKTKFSKPCRVFGGRKYIKLNNGYYLSTVGRRLLSHDIWNYFYPDELLVKGEVIHHRNGLRDDDRIQNYEKLAVGCHLSNHQLGDKNSMYGKVGNFRQSNCDWAECTLPHRKGGFCEKHYKLVRYWGRKGYLLDEIKDVAYMPFATFRERDSYGMFV